MGAIYRFEKLTSTNRYCESLDLHKVDDFTCYWAWEQTAGIGQRGNSWTSNAGENLTFSLVLKPDFLPAIRQFQLTEALSLGVMDFLKGINGSKGFNGLKALIKWPNDIYANGGKICGMLVSNRLAGDKIDAAICGIGFNVNQRLFPDWVPHPMSLTMLTGEYHQLEPLLFSLLDCIERRYNQLRDGIDLEPEYLGQMMNMAQPARYRHYGRVLTATITSVDPHGRLMLTSEDGEHLCCAMKEIELIN